MLRQVLPATPRLRQGLRPLLRSAERRQSLHSTATYHTLLPTTRPEFRGYLQATLAVGPRADPAAEGDSASLTVLLLPACRPSQEILKAPRNGIEVLPLPEQPQHAHHPGPQPLRRSHTQSAQTWQVRVAANHGPVPVNEGKTTGTVHPERFQRTRPGLSPTSPRLIQQTTPPGKGTTGGKTILRSTRGAINHVREGSKE